MTWGGQRLYNTFGPGLIRPFGEAKVKTLTLKETISQGVTLLKIKIGAVGPMILKMFCRLDVAPAILNANFFMHSIFYIL
jgi:hypothetical protein